jgi:hypothetical protein
MRRGEEKRFTASRNIETNNTEPNFQAMASVANMLIKVFFFDDRYN